MAAGKEVRQKIRTVKSTQKITKAMQMVAASKMRRTQERMRQSKPYSEKIRQIIGHLANSNPEYRHTFMTDREIKRVGYIVVSTDKGLCGGLNINLFRALVSQEDCCRPLPAIATAGNCELQHSSDTGEADGDDCGGHQDLGQGEALLRTDHGVTLTRPDGATTTWRARPFFEIV